ncbi:hypothetical protein EJ04DRAFT_513080 [Polyplosphaeria fusca]|uniref:Uncharacterized protein n=1 Tax=Polyplosphaeria fusca TaxID=682080 RepID=A0A9P4V0K2_9PLEO|nr:hypothetical protein EJ04DRAFT_513080 [Polyplosphaeria fusca]
MASKPLTISPGTAQSPVDPALRNSIYSALLDSNGLLSIAATLEHELATSGFTSNLKSYITHLLRSGECTTLDEIHSRVFDKLNHQQSGGANGVNGSNGVNGINGKDGDDEYDLHISERTVREGVKSVRKELEHVCDITVDGEDK